MDAVASVFGGGSAGSAGSSAGGAQQYFNDLAIAELRRQFEETKQNVAPFLDAGTNAVPQFVEGTTVGGLDDILGRIFDSENFKNLVDERQRGIQGQLAAGGLTRSGTAINEAAKVPTDLGFQIEQILSGRQNNLVNLGQNSALGLGQIGQNNSNSIANLFNNTGKAVSSGILTDAQASAAGGSNILKGIGGLGNIFFGGGSSGSSGSSIGTIASIASLIGSFSDPRLKENAEVIGQAKDLKIYQWDWIKEAKNTMIEKCMNIGFMADEVLEKYPHHVGEFCGFKIINYPGLLDELEKS